MAQTTVVRIVDRNGSPQVGVQVVASDILAQWKTTNAAGELSMQFEDNQVFCNLIAVKLTSGAIYTAHLVLEAGDTKEVVVPAT